MKKCIIITSHVEGEIKKLIEIEKEDFIICADGGYDLAFKEHIKPNVVIGDFDSTGKYVEDHEDHIEKIITSSEKDVTDTAMCLDFALNKGFSNIIIIGGMGGRLDHTVANMQNIISFTRKGLYIMMVDQNNIVIPLINSNTFVPKQIGYKISLLSHSEISKGVTIDKVKYPLENHTLYSSYPLGVSNEFLEEEAFVEVKLGEIFIILSKDN